MATNGKSKNIKVNEIGLSKKDYRGHATTLCAGCGHNSISNQIIAASYELDIVPEDVIKLLRNLAFERLHVGFSQRWCCHAEQCE